MEMSKEVLVSTIEKYWDKGYRVPRWLSFSCSMAKEGLSVSVYKSKGYGSRYVTVYDEEKKFKVRFGDHDPVTRYIGLDDCDLYVGSVYGNIVGTKFATRETLKYFKKRKK